MRRIRIIAIDSGVRYDHPAFKGDSLTGFQVTNGLKNDDYFDCYGHGTAVYGILRKCCDIADIINVKIPEIQNGIEPSSLIATLQYIRDYEQADIINLSLGIEVCENTAELKAIIDDLCNKGIIIVSAFSNSGSFSYPARFDNVIGVRAGLCCRKANDFEFVEDTIVNIGAKGGTQRLCWLDPDYIMLAGNSFACAHVTVQVARFMSEGDESFSEILERFKSISQKQYQAHEHKYCRAPFRIHKAAVFPFNKEMHALFRFSSLLNFEIVHAYDTKYSARVGASSAYLLKESKALDLEIENIDLIEWADFDTLILGHTNELAALTGQTDVKESLFQQAQLLNKNVYSFDPVPEKWKYYTEQFYFPHISSNHVPSSRFGMLHRCSRPVVGVFGTSSKQGKFTLQLALRERFKKLGYCVGQIGTEPNSELFGMDVTFPIGYNSTVDIKATEIVVLLNYYINDLCNAQKDIIIVGSQSGTIPYDIGNLQHYTFAQGDFLLGTLPDAVILCVNPYDDFSYIAKTRDYIEAITNAKVIALVVFPMDIKHDWSALYGQKEKLSDEAFEVVAKRLRNIFHIPVYCLGNDRHVESVVNDIIDFF